MEISILCTDPDHPVIEPVRHWISLMGDKGHSVSLHYDRSELTGGDVLFLVSCSQMIRDAERGMYQATLVLHASDLPQGRGWSPHIWGILNGATKITVTLLEADDPVDTGDIWFKTAFTLDGHELLPEINEKLFAAELSLMTRAVEEFHAVDPQPQQGEPGPYLKKRSPEDSRLDPSRSLEEQFDLLRVVDPQRFPAFFDHKGHRYTVEIKKIQK